ncbi:MAG: hypothetical protein VR72_08910 [Clostridiaceae bacterium BRH_c20a]|nr:MAG: hypothetical protein VR72_08910 [Clostridiaceae bacterium BRH_c20a]
MLYWDWVLALGILLFALWLWVSFYKGGFFVKSKKDLQYLIVVVQNKEGLIEAIIRKAILLQRQLGENTKLIIVDLDSSDKTLEIIKRMAYPKNYFTIFLFKDRQKFMEFVEECINEDCFVMDYSNTNDYKSVYYRN